MDENKPSVCHYLTFESNSLTCLSWTWTLTSLTERLNHKQTSHQITAIILSRLDVRTHTVVSLPSVEFPDTPYVYHRDWVDGLCHDFQLLTNFQPFKHRILENTKTSIHGLTANLVTVPKRSKSEPNHYWSFWDKLRLNQITGRGCLAVIAVITAPHIKWKILIL